jgi:hypothetical protein
MPDLHKTEPVVHVTWTPTLEDAAAGRLFFLLDSDAVPLPMRLAIHRELTFRLEDLIGRMPDTAALLLRVRGMERGRP